MSTFASSAGADRVVQVIEEAVREHTGESALRVYEVRPGVLDLEYSAADVDDRVFRSLVTSHSVTRKPGVSVAITERGGAYVVRVGVDEDAGEDAG